MARKLKTIYELFSEYKKEDVDIMLKSLTNEERELVTLRYGEDLENPVTSPELTSKGKNVFYGTLVPKMRGMLESNNLTQGVEKPKFELVESLGDDLDVLEEMDNLNLVVEDEVSNIEPKDIENIENSNVPIEDQLNQSALEGIDDLNHVIEEEMHANDTQIEVSQSMEKDDYIALLNFLNTPVLSNTISELSPSEATIVWLKLRTKNGKCFSTAEIADFLEIEEQEINEVTKNVLTKYKEKMLETIDSAIKIVTGETPVVLRKTDKN